MEERAATPEDLPPLELTRLRDLDLEQPPGQGRPAHVASASGVVRRGDFVYVIGDDLLQIGVFRLAAGGPGELRAALQREPHPEEEDKPDLEALTALPPVDGEPNGGLLGIGSGSKPTRDRGFFWSFGADGSLAGEPRTLDLRSIYDAIRDELGGEINVEGAAVFGDRLWLFHRANEGGGPNTVAEVELADLSRTLAGDRTLDADELRRLRGYDLGELEGVPACFSDATTLLDDLICFTASAEDAESGAIHGSVVGTIDADGRVRRLRTIDPRWKVEGVHAAVDTGVIDFLFVCDQDEADQPSPLLSATMPIDSRFDAA